MKCHFGASTCRRLAVKVSHIQMADLFVVETAVLQSRARYLLCTVCTYYVAKERDSGKALVRSCGSPKSNRANLSSHVPLRIASSLCFILLGTWWPHEFLVLNECILYLNQR